MKKRKKSKRVDPNTIGVRRTIYFATDQEFAVAKRKARAFGRQQKLTNPDKALSMLIRKLLREYDPHAASIYDAYKD